MRESHFEEVLSSVEKLQDDKKRVADCTQEYLKNEKLLVTRKK